MNRDLSQVRIVHAVLGFQNDDDSSVTETSTFSEVTAADEWETETPKKKMSEVIRRRKHLWRLSSVQGLLLCCVRTDVVLYED